MKKFFFACFTLGLLAILSSCTNLATCNVVACKEQGTNTESFIQETEIEKVTQETVKTAETSKTSFDVPHYSDGKMRLYEENVPYMTTRFPNFIQEGDIQIYYSNNVPKEMLEDTIRLIGSTSDTKVITQIFLDTEYDENIDSSNKAYAFDRNIMFIVDYETDGFCSMFERYFFHELGHLLLGEYCFLNNISVEELFPNWKCYFSEDIDEDFAVTYEYYMVLSEMLDIYVKYDDIGSNIEAMEELIATFEDYE